jgi:predicted dehydrogenase
MLARSGGGRREFLKLAASGATLAALGEAPRAASAATRAKIDRPRLGLIGAGGQGTWDAISASRFGDFVAIADVDRAHADRARDDDRIGKKRAEVYEDYRKLLDRDDVDAVFVGTPDHWHSKICIDAMKAGKDVYCEKPLTLTIDEGKTLRRVVEATKRVLQVGTQQRSDHNKVFLMAVALIRAGRIGKVRKVTAAIGSAPSSGPLAPETPPPGLNWDLWLGQAPMVDYTPKRCHADFRWWYEYSGGKLTDWGAHHVDVAHWGLGKEQTGPTTIEVERAELPVAFKDGWPEASDRYNTATTFQIKATFADGVPLIIRDDTENGIMFEGERGKIFVARDRIDLEGGAVAGLYRDPVPESLLRELRHGKLLDGHMENFFACCNDRGKPAADVWSHHRSLTTCHLANIAIRLGNRKLTWDPEKEAIVGDDEANAFLARPQREGYEVVA